MSCNLTPCRFREVPSFGRMTIRRFHHNVSEMKRLAARDFEDTLQCQLPVVEGLFPEHQELVLDVYFDLALFHAMAKMRMHTTSTVRDFGGITRQMCITVRKFQRDTQNIKTYETDHEQTRRINRARKQAQEKAVRQAAVAGVEPPSFQVSLPAAVLKLKEKPLNLETYKWHSAADYPQAVVRKGTLDSFSTQHVCTSC
ncbi:hypothetical protein GGX14DRAFT_373179, partial [Mycena pura]